MVLLDRLRLDIRPCPSDAFELPAREHRRLIREERRARIRTLTVREHGIRARLISELHRENPPVGPRRLELPVARGSVREHAEAALVARAPADRHVHAPAAHPMHIAPRRIERAIATLRLVRRPLERVD